MPVAQRHWKSVIEALVFVSEEPLTVARIKEVLETDDTAGVKRVLRELAEEYRGLDRAFVLEEVAGGYQFRTLPEFAEQVKKLLRTRPERLTRATLETLAIVAYRQPVTGPEIEKIRGVDCATALKTLLERRVIKITGRRDSPGRPMVYGTTRAFLELFNLKGISDLPSLREYREIAREIAPETVIEIPEGEAPAGEGAEQPTEGGEPEEG